MISPRLLVLIVVLMSPAVVLACGPTERLVVGCNTTKGKRIEVCQAESGAVYSFGKRGLKPELTIADNGKNFQWYSASGTGAGTQIFQFANGPYIYAFERNEYRRGDDDGNLTVELRGKKIAEFHCVEKRIEHDVDLLSRPRSEGWVE